MKFQTHIIKDTSIKDYSGTYGPLPNLGGNLRSQIDQLLNLKKHMNLKHEFASTAASMLAKLVSQILPEMKHKKGKYFSTVN